MKIDRIIIEGIANIGHAQLEFGAMNVLIAPNGYGKSNMLKAIAFGLQFITVGETKRQQMLSSSFLPINVSILRNDFSIEFFGSLEVDGEEKLFQYGYKAQWATTQAEGKVLKEWLGIKESPERRFRQLINRNDTLNCLITPSAKGRCTKAYEVTSLQLALPLIATTTSMFFHDIAKQISNIAIPNINTLDNPETY